MSIMTFKRFKQFILEGKGKDPKDIEEAMPLSQDIDPKDKGKCPKCGSSDQPCKCYTEDYYDAKMPRYNPNGRIHKPKDKKYHDKSKKSNSNSSK
jgi:hypothetical protein